MKKEMTGRLEEMNSLYRELLLPAMSVDETVYVLGHENPDSDAVGSAIAYAMLLKSLGIPARAAVPGQVNGETQFALARFGLDEPEIILSVADLPVVLVDHSSISQAVSDLEEARIIGIIDHHGIGDVVIHEPVFIRSARTGAASTLVWLCWVESGQAIPREAALAMLMGILSDTRNLSMNVTGADRLALDALMQLAGIEKTDCQELYTEMRKALANYDGMSDEDIFMADYKAYNAGDVRYGIGGVRASGIDECRKIGERMKRYMEKEIDSFDEDMLFLMVSNIEPDETAMLLTGIGTGAQEALVLAFGPLKDGWIQLNERLSRKSGFVPEIAKVLEMWKV